MTHFRRRTIRWIAVWSVVALGILWDSQLLIGQTNDEVRMLIDQLDANEFQKRQDATDKLEAFIKGNKLTVEQLGILRTYPQNPSLEVLQRRESILATWTTKFPSVRKVLDGVQVSGITESAVDLSFKIDGFEGSIPAPDDNDKKDVDALMKLYESARNAPLFPKSLAGDYRVGNRGALNTMA